MHIIQLLGRKRKRFLKRYYYYDGSVHTRCKFPNPDHSVRHSFGSFWQSHMVSIFCFIILFTAHALIVGLHPELTAFLLNFDLNLISEYINKVTNLPRFFYGYLWHVPFVFAKNAFWAHKSNEHQAQLYLLLCVFRRERVSVVFNTRTNNYFSCLVNRCLILNLQPSCRK